MIISGYFHFLHTVNTAWALKARQTAHNNHQKLILKLKKNPFYSYRHVTDFLKCFKLADTFEPFRPNDVNSENTPPIPTKKQAEIFLKRFFETKMNTSIFDSVHRFLPVLNDLQKKNITFVSTNGCFDVLHPGHINTLKYPDTRHHKFIVLINSDRSIAAFKGQKRPIHTWFYRAALLSEIDTVDYVVVFDNDTPLEAIRQIRPVCHVKGGTFVTERIEAERKLLDEWGGRLLIAPMVENYSTTKVLEKYTDGIFPV
jgi:rfaE bifunctional protein nucleotidyltransferase chain/domain